MPDKQSDRSRAERMVDFGIEEAEITFDLGPPATEEEVREMQEQLDKMTVEEE